MANEQGQTQDGPDSSKCLRLNIFDFTWFYITYIKNDCKKKIVFFYTESSWMQLYALLTTVRKQPQCH